MDRGRREFRRYTAADLAVLLDTSLPHEVAAAAVGRTPRSVRLKRGQLQRVLGLPRVAPGPPAGPRTTIERQEDDGRLVPRWHPHPLRHNRATAVRAMHGLGGVQAALGQRTVSVAERYAEVDAGKADRIAAELG